MEATINKKETLLDGMGAVSSSNEGTTFRVWAPNAENVSVVGDFNNWDEMENPMNSEHNGYWAIHIPSANVGAEYKFALKSNGNSLLRNDPYARQMTHSNGNSVIAKRAFNWDDENFKIPSLNQLVIYEMHIGTFHQKINSGEASIGTFKSAIEKLGYLKNLGINAIEIMPIAEFSGGISWGYNPSSPFAIETDYGSPEDFASFVNAAHKNGIAVFMDVVYNHFGSTDSDLWQFDGWSENDNGGIYFYNDYRAETPWGHSRPDYGRPEVRQFIRDNALMWLEDYHCDGLRWDATSYIRFVEGGTGYERNEIFEGKKMIQDINGEIKAKYPEKILIAEDLNADTIVTQDQRYDGLNFNAQWDSHFVHKVKNILVHQEDNSRNLQEVVNALTFKYNYDVFERIIYTESHDEVANGSSRIPEEIQPGQADGEFAKKRSVLGATLIFTSPGIPMIFQGQEFLEDGFFDDNQGLDWEKANHFGGISKLYQDLIQLRLSHEKSLLGLQGQGIQIIHFNQEDNVLAYLRFHDEYLDNPVLVVLNFSNQRFENYDIGAPLAGSWKTIFNSSFSGYDEDAFYTANTELTVSIDDNYDNQPHKLTFTIAEYAALILTRNIE
ncbi:alpha-amylase family glycosyl hydrolase [uncultured Cyclobacterium sp.]|uniref:alpha-amylase family glycosyl hydrolase n=1 Tax=uncultured Cyclobacterium sp. TaxID=453820 RepID=UPI0030EBBD42|tara:strand:- start:206083 stop:207915 length:1833 start_codon:yes stop_codon:yes gene_type:complete